MSYLFLTGVTGLVGRYLLKDLTLAGVPLAVLVRKGRKASARDRVEGAMAYWEDLLDRKLPRPVVLDGDITEPDLGLDARSLRWVAENCHAVLHNAASLTFVSTGPQSEPWRSNVEGTRHVLELCRQARIREFHHVSTAYVCGLRNGVILESELDVGQELSNDYERSKVQAEKLVRDADGLNSVTVYRPAIIVGDSKTCYTTTFHGFYAPLQAVATMAQVLPLDATGFRPSSARFAVAGNETKNLVPVDWVSAVTSHILTHPEHHGKTYHLTPRHPVSVRLMAEVMEQVLRFYKVRFEGPDQPLEGLTENELLFRELIKVYNTYWRDDPRFDASNTLAACPHLPCPHMDRQMLLRLAEYAMAINFTSPRAKPVELDCDSAKILEPWLETADPDADSPVEPSTLNLQVTGPGGGDWQLTLRTGRLVSVDVGLTPSATATLRLNTDTLAALQQGTLTVPQALDAGRVEQLGVPNSRDLLIDLFDQLLVPVQALAQQ